MKPDQLQNVVAQEGGLKTLEVLEPIVARAAEDLATIVSDLKSSKESLTTKVPVVKAEKVAVEEGLKKEDILVPEKPLDQYLIKESDAIFQAASVVIEYETEILNLEAKRLKSHASGLRSEAVATQVVDTSANANRAVNT